MKIPYVDSYDPVRKTEEDGWSSRPSESEHA